MKILVINAGSSSLKYQLIDIETEAVVAKGLCERIGIEGGTFAHKTSDGRAIENPADMPDHMAAFRLVTEALLSPEHGVIAELAEISAVGHRFTMGGARYTSSVRIDDEVIAELERISPLAPLHSPPQLTAIRACMNVMDPSVPQCAVFDTSFHATMPPKAYMYAVPYEYYEKHGIRRYGFHGTSHRYVSAACAEIMGKPIGELKIITCHLGNGASIAAVDRGQVVDTTMGLTPLDGLMMGTRTGAMDPAIVTFLMQAEGLTAPEADDLMNKRSGILGVSGISSDQRDIMAAIEEGNERAILTNAMFAYQIQKYIGAYTVAMGGLDAIVFTAGVGENQRLLRYEICEGLAVLGVRVDEELNEKMYLGVQGEISAEDSKVRVFVIGTNEELMIARDTAEIIKAL